MALHINLSEQKVLQDFLARRHPEYNRMLNHWRFCEATYEGGRKWFEANIFRYIKEGDQEFGERVQRSFRFNHTREVVDLIQKYIFKSDVARNWGDAPTFVKNLWRSTTLSNLNITQFMRLVSTKASIYGRVWVFVDSTKNDTILTLADEKEVGARCYCYIVQPQDILDIGFSEGGELTWILVREHVRDDQDPIRSTGVLKERYRLWTTDSWYLFEITEKDDVLAIGMSPPATSFNMMQPAQFSVQQLELPGVLPAVLTADKDNKVVVKLVDQGEISIGRVPCFPVDNVIGDNKYSAPALIADIAYLDRAIANYLSNLDAIIQDQTFSQLAMPAQNVLPGTDQYEAIKELGTKRVFLYDGEDGAQPFFLSPDPKQAALIITVVNKIINEIYHSIGMGGERTKQDNAVGIDNSSGVAKAYDFERLNSLLTTKSEALENAENALIELVSEWNGADTETLEDNVIDGDRRLVQYADTFDVRSLYDEFTVAERLAIIDAPKTVRQEQMKQMINKLFPALKDDLRQKMLDDLETWPITGLDQVAIQGVADGNPSAKFPARLTTTEQPGMKPMPPAPTAASKPNAQSSKRQGQVTKSTGK